MCDQCAISQKSLGQALRAFLPDDVKVGVMYDVRGETGQEDLVLTRGDDYLIITADGDDGGYFHWETPESEPELPENVVMLSDYR